MKTISPFVASVTSVAPTPSPSPKFVHHSFTFHQRAIRAVIWSCKGTFIHIKSINDSRSICSLQSPAHYSGTGPPQKGFLNEDKCVFLCFSLKM